MKTITWMTCDFLTLNDRLTFRQRLPSFKRIVQQRRGENVLLKKSPGRGDVGPTRARPALGFC